VEPGEYAWNAYQTYADGEVVEWTGSADDLLGPRART
jgi:hypothetical protein